jgi:hypothetical protein
MGLNDCKICGKPSTHIWRCDAHYKCDDCGSEQSLCFHSLAGAFGGLLCDDCHGKRVQKRIAKFKGKTTGADKVICPHCGYDHRDPWEMGEGEHGCHDCGNLFELSTETYRTYSTRKLPNRVAT